MLVSLFVNYVDRDNGTAQHRYCFDVESATTLVALSSFAESIINAVLNISDARVSGYFYSIFAGNGPDIEPGIGSSVYRRGILIFLANGNELATIEIPAIRSSLMDVNGKWAGIRILERLDDINDAFSFFWALGYDLQDKAGRIIIPFGFEVGGRTS